MIGILFLVLAFVCGWLVWRRMAANSSELLTSFGLQPGAAALLAPWLTATASLTLGLLLLTTVIFALSMLAQVLLPESVYPLFAANLTLFIAVGLLFGLRLKNRHRERHQAGGCLPRQSLGEPLGQSNDQNFAHAPDRQTLGLPGNRLGLPPESCLERANTCLRRHRYFLIALLLFILYAVWLMFSSFHRDGSSASAGASVFSDFSTHTALVSSFAKGRNFPVNYPHFANDGIAYHFLFYFLCGNLHYLGLPIEFAINLPSVLTFVAFCVLLGLLAVSITRQRAAFWLAPYLMIFRSSFAFLTRLRDLWQLPEASLSSIVRAVLDTRTFIGDTPRDDWGLWGLNVYANQRHLLLGFSALIIVVFLFSPLLLPVAKNHRFRLHFNEVRLRLRDRRQWLPQTRQEYLNLGTALLFALLLPYFHGSALVAMLLILAGLMLFSRSWLSHISFAVTAIISATVQGRIFRSGGLPLEPQFLFGFIAEDRTVAGVLSYLFEMSGLVLPLAFLAALLLPPARRLLAVFCLPLLFAFTFSLTPDVTVNHKYLIFTFALAGCLVAGLLARLWQKPGRWHKIRRALTVLLLLVLSLTGWMELFVYRNLNQVRVQASLASPLVQYVEKETPPKSVFVTGPLSYHSLFFTGRQVYFGHAYYAWSAGHDTFGRERKILEFLAAADEDLQTAQNFIATEQVDYLMIDNELRDHAEYVVNEAFFLENFQVVAEFPSLGDMLIIDLHSAR